MTSLASAKPILVVGFDFRAPSSRAMGHALGMVATGAASEVHLVHVVPPDLARDEALVDAIPSAMADIAETLLGRHSVPGPTWAHVRSGRARFEIRRLGFEVGADMVVLGQRSAFVARAGRTDDRAADPYAPFSVLIAGERLELDSRPFQSAKCEHCRRQRNAEEALTPWCAIHRRRGVPAARRLDLPHLLSRVLH